MGKYALWLGAVGGLLSAACSGSSGPDDEPPGSERPPAALKVIRLPDTAPPLFNDSVAFFAKVGRDDEGAIYFQDRSGGRGERFARLRIRRNTLLTRPDGTAFGPNDSVLIVMKAVSPKDLLVEMRPAGLKFSSGDPAELKMEYEETDGDLDRDGDREDDDDKSIEQKLSIWRQETPSDPFVKLGSAKTEGLREFEAKLLGFTRFALAY